MDYISFDHPDWQPLDMEAGLGAALASLGPIDGRLTVDGQVRAQALALPMYEQARLVRLTSPAWRDDVKICFLELNGQLTRLNGTSPPIHEMNAKAPVLLSDDNVLAYLAFFCLFVHGDEGPFFIVHRLDDPLFPAGLADARPAAHPDAPSLRMVFRTPRRFGRDPRGHWRVAALVHYGDTIFASDFMVNPDGKIDMVDDTPLCEDLPMRAVLSLEAPRG